MAEILIGVPFAYPDDATGGTTPADMQLILATKYEYHPRPGGGTTRAGVYRGAGVELRTDTKVRVHQGMVVLDIADNAVVEVAIPVKDIEVGLAAGTAGTVTVAVVPPPSGSNNARLLTTTSTTVQPGWLVLDRLVFPSGWTRTNQAVSNWDREYAVLQGTTSGEISKALDADRTVRFGNNRYKKLAQTFTVNTDSNIAIALSSTIRACVEDGSGPVVPLTGDVRGSVYYTVFLDGNPLVTVERTVTGFASTEFWEFAAAVSAGRHQVWVESRRAAVTVGTTNFFWQVVQGGPNKLYGDFMRVKHDGVRR